MKIYLTLFVSFLCSLAANATVRTVCNSPSVTIAQFSTIQAAINASAASGDTIYVHGSPNSYSGFTITNKQLVIIGPGWNPDKNPSFRASVGPSEILGAGSANTEIQGIQFNNSLAIINGTLNSIRLIRNEFDNTIYIYQQNVTYTGYLFEGNVFYGNPGINATSISIYQNFVFQNNYFYLAGGSHSVTGFNNPLSTILFDHNLWLGPSSGSVRCFSDCQSLIITNNIFVRRDAGDLNSLSSFSNNITFNAGNDNPWNVNSNINSGGNISATDPQMAAQTSVNAGSSNPLLDFTIAAGPANNAGSDGKDIGLLYDATGSLNFANSRNSRLPRIFSMKITSPTIPSGGTLNVEVEGRKSN